MGNWDKLSGGLYENREILKNGKRKFRPNRRIVKKDEPDMNKRKFLEQAAIGAAGVVVSAVSGSLIGKAVDTFSEPKETEEGKTGPTKQTFHKILKHQEAEKKQRPEGNQEPKEEIVVQEKYNEKEFHPEKLAQEILRVYNSPAIDRRFDKKVFTKDFLIAHLFQESRGNKEARSSAGAVGVYQNKPESVVDLVAFLSHLRKKTENLPPNQRCDYSGPEKISVEEAEKVSEFFLKEFDYGRAAGELYLLRIHDKDSNFNSHLDPDFFSSKSPQKQQELLLLAYHDGPSRLLDLEKASPEAKGHVSSVRSHMETAKTLHHLLEKERVAGDLDCAILEIMQELDRGENKKKKEETMVYWVKKIKEAYDLKRMGDWNSQTRLSAREIREIFA